VQGFAVAATFITFQVTKKQSILKECYLIGRYFSSIFIEN
jgi:hypothetical protein